MNFREWLNEMTEPPLSDWAKAAINSPDADTFLVMADSLEGSGYEDLADFIRKYINWLRDKTSGDYGYGFADRNNPKLQALFSDARYGGRVDGWQVENLEDFFRFSKSINTTINRFIIGADGFYFYKVSDQPLPPGQRTGSVYNMFNIDNELLATTGPKALSRKEMEVSPSLVPPIFFIFIILAQLHKV